jgi:hypothetical protein
MFAHIAGGWKGLALLEWRSAALIAAGVIAAGGLAFATDTRAQSPDIPSVTVGPVVQITTDPSPLSGCTEDDVPGQEAAGSIVYPETEIEPYIDVNPTDPR